MQVYRDPDDTPIDPTAEADERLGEPLATRQKRSPNWGPADPDALRPARLAGDDAGDVAPDEPAERA